MARLVRLREIARETLWLAPAIGLLFAMALTVATIQIDESVEVGSSAVIGFDGGSSSARSVLSTIAASMLTFLALVFTLTIVALQLASDYSPRLLRTFLLARATKVALGLFVATFTYAVLVLREVSEVEVPELSVTIAIVLVLLSVLVFVYYVSNVAQSLRIASIVETAGAAARAELAAKPPPGADAGDPGDEPAEREQGWKAITGSEPRSELRWGDEPGVVTALDLDGIRDRALSAGAIVELCAQVGDFLPGGTTVLRSHGTELELTQRELSGLVATAKERTYSQDAAFGLRQLADIGVRALSPGINDPTTAVQALDQIHDILLRLGRRTLYTGVLRGPDGEVRVLVPVHSWEEYVRLGLDEIRLDGVGSMQVTRRLLALLRDLERRLPEARREPIIEQRELVEKSIESGFDTGTDRRRARLTANGAGAIEGGSDGGDV